MEFQCKFVLRPSKVRKLVRTNQFQVKSTKRGTGRKFVTLQYIAMGSIHQNGDRLREPKVGDTHRPAAGPGSRRWVDRLCRQHERRVLVLSDDYLSLSKSASDLSMWTPNVLRSFLVKNRPKPWRVIFLPSLACRDQSQIIDLDCGSRASFLYIHCEPQELLFCRCVSRSTFHKFPFFFFYIFLL